MSFECQEFRLTAACVRWPPSAQRSQAIRAAAAGALDWQRFLRIVARQRVAGLVHEALHSAAVEVPPQVMQTLARGAAGIALQSMRLATESVRLQRLFDAAGIRAIFTKGASLAMLGYRSLTLKHSKDIDLFVARQDLPRALDLVRADGYELHQPAGRLSDAQLAIVLRYHKEVVLFHKDTKTQLELHWKLVDNPILLQHVDISSPTQAVVLAAGASVRTLCNADLFAYLCVHGGMHGWSRLKWLADVAALISGKEAAEIEGYYAIAKHNGAGRCAALALLLANNILGVRLPDALALQFSRIPTLARMQTAVMTIMAGRYADRELVDDRFAPMRIALMRYRLGEGWRFKLTTLHSQMMIVPDLMRVELHPRLQWLYLLYPLLRIPLWLWRRLRPRRGQRAQQKLLLTQPRDR